MALIHIKREHRYTRDQARTRIDDLAQELAESLKVRYVWDGDVLRFKRTGAVGAVALGENVVDIKVKVSGVLAPMKGKIEKAIVEALDKVEPSS